MATQTYIMFHPTLWSPRFTEYFYNAMHAGKFFDNFSDLAADGGNTLRIPAVGKISVSAVDWGTGTVSDSAITDTSVVLNISRWMSTKRTLSDANYAVMASSYRLRDGMAQSQTKSLAEFFDKEILDGCASFTQQASHGYAVKVISNSTTALGTTGIEDAIRLMHSNNYPLDECAFFIHPSPYWAHVAKISKYYDVSQFGGKTMTASGTTTSLYGIPMYVTSAVNIVSAGVRNILAHKSAVAYAIGNLPGIGQQVRITEKDSEHLRKVIYTQILYGVKCVRVLGGVRIYTRST